MSKITKRTITGKKCYLYCVILFIIY